MDHVTHPLSLRQTLDAGVDLRFVLGDHTLELLLDTARAVESGGYHAAGESRRVRDLADDPRFERACLNAIRTGHRPPDANFELQRLEMHWGADLIDDPSLVPAVLAYEAPAAASGHDLQALQLEGQPLAYLQDPQGVIHDWAASVETYDIDTEEPFEEEEVDTLCGVAVDEETWLFVAATQYPLSCLACQAKLIGER